MDIQFNNNGNDIDITLEDGHLEIKNFDMFEFGPPDNLMYGLTFTVVHHEITGTWNTVKVYDFQFSVDGVMNYDSIVKSDFAGRIEHGKPNGQISRPSGDKGNPITYALSE